MEKTTTHVIAIENLIYKKVTHTGELWLQKCQEKSEESTATINNMYTSFLSPSAAKASSPVSFK